MFDLKETGEERSRRNRGGRKEGRRKQEQSIVHCPLSVPSRSNRRHPLINQSKETTGHTRENPLALVFYAACTFCLQQSRATIVLSAQARPQGEHVRRFNTNFAVLQVLTTDEPGNQDAVSHVRGESRVHRISMLNKSYDALFFALLLPGSDDGWHAGWQETTCQHY